MSRHVLRLCQLKKFSYSCTALYCCLGTALSFDCSSLSLQTEVNFHQKGAQLWCRFPAYGRLCWEGVVSGLASVTLADDKSHTKAIPWTVEMSCVLLRGALAISCTICGDLGIDPLLTILQIPNDFFFLNDFHYFCSFWGIFFGHVTKCQPFCLCDSYQLKHFLHRASKNWRAQNLCITCCNWVLNLIIIGPPAGPKKSH